MWEEPQPPVEEELPPLEDDEPLAPSRGGV